MLRSDNSTWAWPSPCFPVANTLVDWQVTTAYDQVEDRFAKLMHWWDWQSYAVCLPTVSNPPKNMCRKTPPFSASLLASFGVTVRVFTQESWFLLLCFSIVFCNFTLWECQTERLKTSKKLVNASSKGQLPSQQLDHTKFGIYRCFQT